MTGTAETEATEFFDIYKLGVLVIPTNKPCVRKDRNDSVYKTRREKFAAVVREIQEIHAQGRPMLVGTVSVETSEQLSKMLKKVASCTRCSTPSSTSRRPKSWPGPASAAPSPSPRTWPAAAPTSSLAPAWPIWAGCTSWPPSAMKPPHRPPAPGRCARQGDPGSSHFFISLEDDLMRLFGSDKIVKYMEKMGLEEGQELEHPS